jgi:hypothetical protein
MLADPQHYALTASGPLRAELREASLLAGVHDYVATVVVEDFVAAQALCRSNRNSGDRGRRGDKAEALIDTRQVQWQNRAHFFAISSRLMRRILVDHARARGYRKRGGGAHNVMLDEG